jgi:hypothetical protein
MCINEYTERTNKNETRRDVEYSRWPTCALRGVWRTFSATIQYSGLRSSAGTVLCFTHSLVVCSKIPVVDFLPVIEETLEAL